MGRAVQWQSHCHGCKAAMGGVRKLEQLGYSVTQEILWDAIIIMIMQLVYAS